jgi:hypothetical protein
MFCADMGISARTLRHWRKVGDPRLVDLDHCQNRVIDKVGRSPTLLSHTPIPSHKNGSEGRGEPMSMQHEAASEACLQVPQEPLNVDPSEASRRLAMSSLSARKAIPIPFVGAGVPFGNSDLRSDLVKDSVRGGPLGLPEDGVSGPRPEPDPADVTPSMTGVPRPSAFAHPAIVRMAATE